MPRDRLTRCPFWPQAPHSYPKSHSATRAPVVARSPGPATAGSGTVRRPCHNKLTAFARRSGLLCFVAGLVVGLLAAWAGPGDKSWPVPATAAAGPPATGDQQPAAAAGQAASDQVSAAKGQGAAPQPSARAQDGKLRIIAFGAHPDDAEIQAGGVAAMWAAQGHHVKFVSVTNGDLGHYQMGGGLLARRRTREVQEAARRLGIEATEVLDIHDGELMPTLENRKKMARLIRDWQADIVMSHRPCDYNPDHRYAGVLLQDTAFMVTVPGFCADTPEVEPNPVYLFFQDNFTRPSPFRADIAVAIDLVMAKKLDALDALGSQFYETVYGVDKKTREERLRLIPKDAEGRRRYLAERFQGRSRRLADRYRLQLLEWYGPERGQKVQYAELFEICEYGRQPTKEEIRKLFPFLPG